MNNICKSKVALGGFTVSYGLAFHQRRCNCCLCIGNLFTSNFSNNAYVVSKGFAAVSCFFQQLINIYAQLIMWKLTFVGLEL
jgi:hypothetical protein